MHLRRRLNGDQPRRWWRVWHGALAAGVAAAVGCGGHHFEAAAPAPSDSGPQAQAVAPPVGAGDTPEDSAADEAALLALQELEFKSLGKGEDHARGIVPLSGLQQVEPSDVSGEGLRLFDGSRGGAASATSPTYDIDVENFASRSRVQYYVDYFLGPASDRFQIWLSRLPRYEGMIRSRFRLYGVPEDLVYLGLIESGYSNTAVSRARAVGMWQFIAATGRRYGLQVDDWVDERRDPFKATEAAARYLLALDSTFGSWYLAAAAYNAGEGRVSRGLQRLPEDPDGLSDETFFTLSERRYLRRETRDYVPKLIAAALIAKEPLRYGFDTARTLEPFVFDEITVPDQTGLDVLAGLADTTRAALMELNPHYFRGVTPPKRKAIVRVPRGKGSIVAQRYAELPPGERVTFLEHRVVAGETLGHISRQYHVSLSQLLAANPGVEARRLRIGTRLTIPVSGGARREPASVVAARQARPARPTTYHVVKRGESLWVISRRFGVTVASLRRWNDLAADEVLRVGQRLRVSDPSRADESR